MSPRRLRERWRDEKYTVQEIEKNDFTHLYLRSWDLVKDYALKYLRDYDVLANDSKMCVRILDREKLNSGCFLALIKLQKAFREDIYEGISIEITGPNWVNKYMDEVCKTDLFYYRFNVLKELQVFEPNNIPGLKKKLHSLWFEPNLSSCLFKHIFIEEVDWVQKKISGCHSFTELDAHQLENRINYTSPAILGNALCPLSPPLSPRVGTVKFEIQVPATTTHPNVTLIKHKSSLFIASPAQLDFLLYSYCLLKDTPPYIAENTMEKLEIVLRKDALGNIVTIFPVTTKKATPAASQTTAQT